MSDIIPGCRERTNFILIICLLYFHNRNIDIFCVLLEHQTAKTALFTTVRIPYCNIKLDY